MNELEFRKQLKNIARDLDLIWDPVTHLWGVYQVRASRILVGNASVRPWKLFDITEPDGRSFRLMGPRDLARAAMAVNSGHLLQKKGADWYNKQLESKEADRKVQGAKKVDDQVAQAAKEIRYKLAANPTVIK